MTLPKPPATTRKVKSHDDAIAYGIRDLTAFCKSINAIWILAKATNYVGFTDAQRAECDEAEAAARRRHAGLEAADAATFGIVNVDRMETAARRASGIHPPADDDAEADEAAVRADIRQLRRQDGYFTHIEQDEALWEYVKTVTDNEVFLEAISEQADDKGEQAVTAFFRRFALRTAQGKTAAMDKEQALLASLKTDMDLLAWFSKVVILAKRVAWHFNKALDPAAVVLAASTRIESAFGAAHIFTSEVNQFRRDNFGDNEALLAAARPAHILVDFQTMLGTLMEKWPPAKTILRTDIEVRGANKPEVRGANKPGRDKKRETGGNVGHFKQAIPCPWCATYLQRNYNHTFEECRNKNDPRHKAAIERAKQDGQLQVPAFATTAAAANVSCMFCKDADPPHSFGPLCPMYSGFHRINDAYRATLTDAASASAAGPPSMAAATQAPGNPAFRSFLASERATPGPARPLMSPSGIAKVFTTDTWVVAKYQDHEGTSLIHGPRDFMLPGYNELQRWDPEYHHHVPQKRYRYQGFQADADRRNALTDLRIWQETAHAMDTLAALFTHFADRARHADTPPEHTEENSVTRTSFTAPRKRRRRSKNQHPQTNEIVTASPLDQEHSLPGPDLPPYDNAAYQSDDMPAVLHALFEGSDDDDDPSSPDTIPVSLLAADVSPSGSPDQFLENLQSEMNLNHYFRDSTFRGQLDSGAGVTLTPHQELVADTTPVLTTIQMADNSRITRMAHRGVFVGHTNGIPWPRHEAYYVPDLPHTLISQPAAVTRGAAFIHTPTHGAFTQPDTGACPICHPHPERITLSSSSTDVTVSLHPPPTPLSTHNVHALPAIDVDDGAVAVPIPIHLPASPGSSPTMPGAPHHFPPSSPILPAIPLDTIDGSPTSSPILPAIPLSSTVDAGSQTPSPSITLDQRTMLLWHTRMGGIGEYALQTLARTHPTVFRFKPTTSLPPCECCHRSRARRQPAPSASTRQPKVLAEIHFDLFFIQGDILLYLVDRASRMEWGYFLEQKNDVKLALQQFIIDCNQSEYEIRSLIAPSSSTLDVEAIQAELQSKGLNQNIKMFYSDNAGEHIDSELTTMLFDLYIDQAFSVVESQHQNGLAEHAGGWSLMKAMRHDLDLSNLSKGFRRDCIRLNIARRACTPRRALHGKTPFEMVWPHQTPQYKYFKVFGSACTLLRHEKTVRDKTIPRGEPAIYIGVASGEKHKHSGFLLWVPRLRQRIIAEHVQFNEHRLPARKEPYVPHFHTALPGYITRSEFHHHLHDDTDTDLPTCLLDTREDSRDPLHLEDAATDDSVDAINVFQPSQPLDDPVDTTTYPGARILEGACSAQDRRDKDDGPPSLRTILPWLRQDNVTEASDELAAPSPPLTRARARDADNATIDPPEVPLTPLAQRIFDRLCDDEIYEHHTLLTPPSSPPPPDIPCPSNDVDDGAIAGTGHGFIDESRILFDEVTALHARAAIDLIHSKLPPSSPDHFDSVSFHSSKLGLDILTGDSFDATGYLTAGNDDFDQHILSQDFLVRAYVKSLKAHARTYPSQKSDCVKTITLLRNPKTVKEALGTPQFREWIDAIHREMDSLIEKNTFAVQDLPTGRKVIPTRLVLKIKLASDGSIDKMKARCCVLGFRQQSGLDYNPDNVYSPMTEPTTVRALLAITNKLGLRADHLDIRTAFLNGILPPDEQFYCSPPPGFRLPPGKCWLIQRGLYGAHQSGALWSQTWRTWVKDNLPDFREAGTERCVYVFRQHANGKPVDLEELRGISLEPDEELIILVMNTDDLLLLYTDSALARVNDLEALINKSFDATPREPVEQYLGLHVARDADRHYLCLDARRHVYEFIRHMDLDPHGSASVSTPLDPHVHYSKADCPDVVDTALRERIWSAHGKLIHLAVWARPDLAHAVSVLGRYVHNPSLKHWESYVRVAKYLIRTKDYRLVYGTPDAENIDEPYFYTDSAWGDELDERRSTGSYVCFLDGAGVSWKVKLSSTVCLSTQEAEYNAQTEGTKEALNLRMLLRDLGFGQRSPTTLFCDNKGAITMSLHPTNKPATRHMDMRHHFCRQHTELGHVRPLFKPTRNMVADFISKQTIRETHIRHALRTFGLQSAPVPMSAIQHLVD